MVHPFQSHPSLRRSIYFALYAISLQNFSTRGSSELQNQQPRKLTLRTELIVKPMCGRMIAWVLTHWSAESARN